MITLDSPQCQVLRATLTEENKDCEKGHVWLRISLILKISIHLYEGTMQSCFLIDFWGCGTEGSIGPDSFCFGNLSDLFIQIPGREHRSREINRHFCSTASHRTKPKRFAVGYSLTRLICIIKINCAHQKLQTENPILSLRA